MQNIKDIVSSFIQEQYIPKDTKVFNENTRLLTSGIIDSISALELVEFLEKKFQIEFQPHEVDQDNLDTVEKIVQFIKAKKAAASGMS